MTPTKTRPHKPMLAQRTREILSLSLCTAASISKCFGKGKEGSPPVRDLSGDQPAVAATIPSQILLGHPPQTALGNLAMHAQIASQPSGLNPVEQLHGRMARELLARRASGHICPQSISCLLCATSLTGPDSRSSLCLQPSWTLERRMTACSTLSSGHPYSEREFMARCLQPYSHCIVEVQ